MNAYADWPFAFPGILAGKYTVTHSSNTISLNSNFEFRLKFCRGHDQSGKALSYRCGIKTCRKCLHYRFSARNHYACPWDDWLNYRLPELSANHPLDERAIWNIHIENLKSRYYYSYYLTFTSAYCKINANEVFPALALNITKWCTIKFKFLLHFKSLKLCFV